VVNPAVVAVPPDKAELKPRKVVLKRDGATPGAVAVMPGSDLRDLPARAGG